jgi:hypothetical protein
MLLGPIIVFAIFGAFAFTGVRVGNIGKDTDPEADVPEKPTAKANNVCHAMGYPCMQILIALMLVLYVFLVSTAAAPFDCVGECETGWFVTLGCLGSGLESKDWCVSLEHSTLFPLQ